MLRQTEVPVPSGAVPARSVAFGAASSGLVESSSSSFLLPVMYAAAAETSPASAPAPALVFLLEEFIITRDNELITKETKLNDQDEIKFLSVISGG